MVGHARLRHPLSISILAAGLGGTVKGQLDLCFQGRMRKVCEAGCTRLCLAPRSPEFRLWRDFPPQPSSASLSSQLSSASVHAWNLERWPGPSRLVSATSGWMTPWSSEKAMLAQPVASRWDAAPWHWPLPRWPEQVLEPGNLHPTNARPPDAP